MNESEEKLIEEGLARLLSQGGATPIETNLEQFGWFSLFDQEPGTAVRLLFGQQGAQGTDWAILPLVIAMVLGDPVSTQLCADSGTALVLPAVGTPGPVGRLVESPDLVHVDGLLVGEPSGQLLVVADVNGRHQLGEWDGPSDAIGPPGGLDLTAGWRTVTGLGRFTPIVLSSGVELAKAWEEAVAVARLGLASELTAIGDRLLHVSVEHVTSRKQFGRALGSFQAIQHQLAEVEVDLAVARSAVLEAATERGYLSCALAKVLAARAAIRSMGRTQQLLGGMGFTWEHGLHRDIRRVITLESLLGTTAELERELGAIVQSGPIPELAKL
jgi:hypothetical protein